MHYEKYRRKVQESKGENRLSFSVSDTYSVCQYGTAGRPAPVGLHQKITN